MPGKETADRLKISLGVGATIIVVVVGALYAVNKDVATKGDVESGQAMSLRISTWVKEEIAKVDGRQVASEARVTTAETLHHNEVMRQLEIMQGVERDILSRLPRRLARREE